jgi:glycosyltransferase involved in cell wall biosynthesis
MPHVCLVNSRFPPETYGGAENYVLRTAKELQRRGHEVDIITTRRYDGIASLTPERETYEGLNVWRFYPLNVSYESGENPFGIPGKGIWHQIDTANPHVARTIGKLLDRLGPDLVHTNNLMGISTGIGRVIQGRNLPHVHTLHDYSLICPKSNLLRELTAEDDMEVCEDPPVPCRAYKGEKRTLLGTPDVVTGPSQHVIDVHRNHGYFSGVPATRVRLGIKEVVDKPSNSPEEPAVLYVGKHLRAKGLDTLIKAARRLPDVRFHFCGSGPYDEASTTAAEKLSNTEYHGYVSEEKLRRLRREVSAAVVPSIWMENSPMTIYESFAEGIPVIGSDIGGIPELVTPGETGELFEPGDVNALIKAIVKITDANQENRELRENALAFAREHTIEDHADRLIESLYEPVLGGNWMSNSPSHPRG